MLATGYDTLARRSEMVALRIDDIAAAADGSGTVTIRRSKTDQQGEGHVRYLAPDTMRHVSAWLAAAAKLTDGPLFRAVTKGGCVGTGSLDGAAVADAFLAMARDAGLSGVFSGHSTRVGAAQDAVAAGTLPAALQMGGWKSPEMLMRYSARLDAARGGAAQLAKAQRRGLGFIAPWNYAGKYLTTVTHFRIYIYAESCKVVGLVARLVARLGTSGQNCKNDTNRTVFSN